MVLNADYPAALSIRMVPTHWQLFQSVSPEERTKFEQKLVESPRKGVDGGAVWPQPVAVTPAPTKATESRKCPGPHSRYGRGKN